MSFVNNRLEFGQKILGHKLSFDLENNSEAIVPQDDNHTSASPFSTASRFFPGQLKYSSMIRKFLCYPSPGSLQLRKTSWLDGVRGVAALGVYIFHAMGCWASVVAAWHADKDQNNILQLPILRTVFVSGGTAVSLFFALSGYVLTQNSLRWIRGGFSHQVYPAVSSSLFRRGFRLYLPPVILTFCEMVATRFGFMPPLNFAFVPEPSLSAQFKDWLAETNRLINPIYNCRVSLRGLVIHPKYDAVIWTIPIEFYGSLVCYLLLFVLARVRNSGIRMGLVALFSGFCMALGSWNLFCFSAGMLIADLNLGQEGSDKITSIQLSRRNIIWSLVFAMAFYVAGFPALIVPEAKLNPMPGFETLRTLIPMSLSMEDHSRFWWSLSGVALLLSISQLTQLKGMFESNICQYLGKISFSLYLVHEFCIVLFGLSIQRLLLHLLNIEPHANTVLYWVLCGTWYTLFTVVVFAIAARVEKWVDAPSVRVARWLEGKCSRVYRNRY
ncbi:hypothetical protein BP6252_11552 [Coleophoma cylindrospora]|uniref:Acyltransferase 3 domain-containing protein n=1 Tax=Coleophoma cylindrospora TaxID=1849047 RepID=A0A3D8QK15_9HELO|nr:hypothetical protein BP6252_11552 [Coleophoma cylindrospora]